jgi:hypothetical protein
MKRGLALTPRPSPAGRGESILIFRGRRNLIQNDQRAAIAVQFHAHAHG